jgi:hypothetical protein
MTVAGFNTLNTEGIDFSATYTGYTQSSAVSSTNTPDYPGPTGPFTLGQVALGTDGSSWVYVLAGGAIAAGDAVLITNTAALWTANSTTNALAVSKLGDLVGVALVAIASGSYGWIQRAGKCSTINAVASVAANALLRTTTTAGRLTGTSAAGSTVQVTGIVLTTANGGTAGAFVEGILNFPVIGSND